MEALKFLSLSKLCKSSWNFNLKIGVRAGADCKTALWEINQRVERRLASKWMHKVVWLGENSRGKSATSPSKMQRSFTLKHSQFMIVNGELSYTLREIARSICRWIWCPWFCDIAKRVDQKCQVQLESIKPMMFILLEKDEVAPFRGGETVALTRMKKTRHWREDGLVRVALSRFNKRPL